ncbi:MAG: PilT/PilU family type 4a pilus ATPase [Planctomycetota bacterium]|nr:MAG: PilT/PilU family type 4a pilus ATPase [Planctomycetota bacterium]
MAFDLHALLQRVVHEDASDLFLKVGSPPSMRIDGRIRFLQAEPLTVEGVEQMLERFRRVKPDARFESAEEVDLAYDLPGIGRFRVNVYRQRGHFSFALRYVKSAAGSFEELELPSEPLRKLASLQRGLVLVTGVTGSGKSTTLAAIINHINTHYNKHIVTIEDPIEFVYQDRRSIISQREIGTDTTDFETALKHVVRQAPDVIMIGEMRDRVTMEAAIHAAETGHLVLSTLHTVNAQQTVERIINYFPPHQHDLVRLQLSMVLEGVISQRLLPRRTGRGRIAAVELMMRSPTIRDLIAEGRTRELYNAIKEGEYFGSQTFNQSLRRLYEGEKISLEEAVLAADNPEELKMEIRGIIKGSRAADFDFDY